MQLLFLLLLLASAIFCQVGSPQAFLELKNYVDILESHTFYEFWYFKDHNRGLLSSFNSDSGLLIIEKAYTVDYHAADTEDGNPEAGDRDLNSSFPLVGIQIYDGEYVDNPSLLFRSANASTTVSLNAEDATLSYKTILSHGVENLTSYQCDMTVNFRFFDNLLKVPFIQDDQKIENLALYVDLASIECDFNVTGVFLSMDSYISSREKYLYLLVSAGFGIVNMLGGLIAGTKFRKRPRESLRVTTFTLVIFVLYDALISGTLLIIRRMTSSFWEWVSLLTFPFITFIVDFYVFMCHEMSLTFATDPRNRDLACKEYAGILGCSILTVFLLAVAILSLSPSAVLLFCFGLYVAHPMPQIFYNFSHNKSFHFNFWTWGLIGLSKYYIIAYLKLDSNNIFKISPNHILGLSILVLILLQWIILFIQSKFPTFGMKPPNSHRKIGDDTCPICLEGFGKHGGNDIFKEVIKTPCGHFYHVRCLRSCVNVNEKCPMCRADIPDFWECSSSSVYEDDYSQF